MFGEGSASGIVVDQDGAANNSKNITEHREESNTCHESDSGAGRDSRGYGSASLAECLNIMAGRICTTIPATCACASGEGDVDNLSDDEMNEFQTRLDCEGVRVAQEAREHEQISNDTGNAIARVMDAREDL